MLQDNFDRELCGKLRNLVSSTNIFWKDKQEKTYYNHLCAMMDRVDESMGYILNHTEVPKTNDDFILFMMHTCVVKDSIKKVMGLLGLTYDKFVKDMPGYLTAFCNQTPFDESIKLTDDTIFNYLRSISFAHPLETEKNYITREILHAKHCSPFVMLDRGICYHGNVGVFVYSDTSEHSIAMQISYSDLLNYAYSRYSLIKYIIEELNNRLRSKEEKWKQRKVVNTADPLLRLEDIKSILEERYIETYDIDIMISLLTCKYTRQENDKNVKFVQEELIKRIPTICDAIDDMDIEAAYQIYKDILYSRPSKMHQNAHYELEKIFCYLNEDTRYIDQEFGKNMARWFAKGFASDWVVMDIDNMSFEEIQMLTRIACFMEKQKQDKQREIKTE